VLAFQITAAQLRAIAPHIYVRGEAYFREGRVVSCVADTETIDGVVTGSASYASEPSGEQVPLGYRVRVSSGPAGLVAACTCPVQDEICKHAVALVLCYLGQRSGHPAPVPVVGAFTTRPEMERWAEEHHVQHALMVSADVLCAELTLPPEDHWIRSVLARLSIRDVGSLELAARHARARGVDVALAKAAYRTLHHAAAIVRDAIVEEAARAEHPPDPAFAPLWSRLVQLRRVVRAHAFPRSRTARAANTWSFDAPLSAIVWKEQARILRPRDYGTFALASRLTIPSGGDPRLECTCDVPLARCTHALALIDATLDVLEDPARALVARTLAEELLRPGWSRALLELDVIEAKAARPRATIEVWWHVEHELGTLTLSPTVKKQTRKGTMSNGARMSVARLLDEHRESLADRDLRIAEHLASWAPTTRAAGTYPVRAFLALVGHPRISSDESEEPIELARVQLGFNALAAGDHIRLEPAIEGARFSPKLLGTLLQVFAPGEPLFFYDFERKRGLLVDVNDDARQLWNVLEKHGDAFPPESHTQLLERLGRMEARLPLDVPHTLKGKQLPSETTIVVRLRLLPDLTLELEPFVRPGPGAPLFHPGTGPRDVLLARDGERAYVRRELASEPARVRALLDQLPLGDAEEGPPGCFRIAETDGALQLVAALQTPPAGLEAQWLDAQPIVRGSVGPEALRVQIERKRDWFGITGELELESGRLELAVLLDAARRQQRFVRVDDRRWIELTETLSRRLLAVADQAFLGKTIELSPGAVPAIRALAEAGAKVDASAEWELLTQRLASSRKLRPKPPATLEAKLRDYQLEGHAWLTRIAAWGAGACLADDMGLGKTMQAIAVLLDRARHGPALVLAPTSVTFNWVQELRRFAPTLRPILYTEQPDRATALAKLGKKDVLIASYGLLVRDAEQLAATKFATLVIDEAQALKNPSTRRARAARTLDAGFRIALSGTPFENHLGELWSLFSIVFPGLLGSWEQFRERFAIPIERGKDPDARQALSRVLRPFLLRRTKQEVARELPPRTEIQVPVALSDEEQALYEDARLAAVAELNREGQGKQAPLRDGQRRFQVLAALTRLRLLASHPKLYDRTSTIPSSKLRRVLELLEELRSEGHRALVFSQFTSHLALVREALDAAGFTSLYLDGSTPAGQRSKLIQAFQDGQGDVFLISLKAGGTGINLTAADYIIHLDPWWNPAVEDQATDRAHRIGQTKPVTVYRLITRGTIEEQIVALHHDKRALVAGILEGSDVAARLTMRDLLSLLQESRQ